MSKCKAPCNKCHLPVHSDVELESYLDKYEVNCGGCGDRLVGALIPCCFHECNKNYCLKCCISSDLQWNYCLRLTCCDKTLTLVKHGQMEFDKQLIDNHTCTDCVEWLKNKKSWYVSDML